ncbi:MAG: hypothetical protein M3R65_09980 [Gemmatimonadota bacterium]|nr:hypothetical protein [Gemmatimonadota bacterium]
MSQNGIGYAGTRVVLWQREGQAVKGGGEPTIRMVRKRSGPHGRLLRLLAVIAVTATPFTVGAQVAQVPCRVVCDPAVTVIPSSITNHLFSQPVTQTVASGAIQKLASRTNLELIFAVGMRTAIPRLGLYGSVQWLPNASEQQNPFTLYAASDIGKSLRANAPTVSGGLSYSLLTPTDTRGIVALDAHVGDLYSSAARPSDASSYTHKLDLTAIASWSVFGAFRPNTYVHGVSLVTMLDYVATGLPRAGDEVPKGERVFLTNVHSASFIAGLSFPLTSK